MKTFRQYERFTHESYAHDYVIDYPKNFDPAKKYPVMFYFHGMGGLGQPIEWLADNAPLRRERLPEDIDFILVVPVCPDHRIWLENFPHVVEFVRYIRTLAYVDTARVYLGGSSMGGYTCWLLAVTHPEFFSAATICCGGGLYWAAQNINFPVKAFHGSEDPIVLPRESEIMVQAINGSGGRAELVIYEGVSHGVWDPVFTDPATYYWLAEQKR